MIPARFLLPGLLLLGAATLPAPPAAASQADDCMQPASRTADEIGNCLHAAGEAAEARLNDTYRKAIAALDPPSQEMLREAQRHWVAFREAELRAQQGPWRNGRSTIKRAEASLAIIHAIEDRERALRLYLPD